MESKSFDWWTLGYGFCMWMIGAITGWVAYAIALGKL